MVALTHLPSCPYTPTLYSNKRSHSDVCSRPCLSHTLLNFDNNAGKQEFSVSKGLKNDRRNQTFSASGVAPASFPILVNDLAASFNHTVPRSIVTKEVWI